MSMRLNLFGTFIVGSTLALAGAVAAAAQQASPAQASSPAQDPSQGRRGRGMGGFPGGGRGVLGSVTEVAADHYTIKTDSGETYIVHYSANTRIVKQGPGRRQGGGGNGAGEGAGDRAAPQTLKPTDIKVGDFITAGGEVDAAAKSVGAVFIAQVDPERAKQMREMQANYGKTWLAGRITAIEGTTITIEGLIDHTPHTIAVDENTSLRQRRDSITLADIKPGQQLRAEGSVKNGAFLATQVTAMEPQNRDQNREPNRDPSPGAACSQPKPQ
jgi:preprotein translocase subunit YajC